MGRGRGSIRNRPGCKQKSLGGSPLCLSYAIFPPGDRPWEMNKGNEEETKSYLISIEVHYMRESWGWGGGENKGERESKTYLFDSFNSLASATYQAANAVNKLNKLAALMIGVFGLPLASRCKYPSPSNRNTR